MNRRVAIIGVPSSAGAHWPGQEKTPYALRRAGLLDRLDTEGFEVMDLGDLAEVLCRLHPEERRHQNLTAVADVARQVADRVAAARKMGALPLVIGGDCTITVGAVSGFLETTNSLGLIYMDGAPDLNSPKDSPTGILDSMGVTHLLGEGARELSGIGPTDPLLREEDIVLFAFHPNNLNPAEARSLAERAIHELPVTEFAGQVSGAARQALSFLDGHDELLVHFDVDVIEFVDFPVANFPQYNHGVTLAEAMEALEVFAGSPRLAGLVVTEFNPDRDLDGLLAQRFTQALADALSAGEGKAGRRGSA